MAHARFILKNPAGEIRFEMPGATVDFLRSEVERMLSADRETISFRAPSVGLVKFEKDRLADVVYSD